MTITRQGQYTKIKIHPGQRGAKVSKNMDPLCLRGLDPLWMRYRQIKDLRTITKRSIYDDKDCYLALVVLELSVAVEEAGLLDLW